MFSTILFHVTIITRQSHDNTVTTSDANSAKRQFKPLKSYFFSFV